jgi:hypothetical protein
MARALQRISVPTAILAVALVQGCKLEANFVLRLSLDSSDDLPREKAA